MISPPSLEDMVIIQEKKHSTHAGLVMEARSALAEIYGDIHAEPFKDGKSD
ncbi:hypothetical protein [Staphylococcus aureus]|uniref:hypothetical protein n=1 Tax=Staphylococcus aureus TaxID=1280 RepID=UPI0039A5D8B8